MCKVSYRGVWTVLYQLYHAWVACACIAIAFDSYSQRENEGVGEREREGEREGWERQEHSL